MRIWTALACSLLLAAPVAAEDATSAGRRYVGIEGGASIMNGFDPQIPGVSDTGFEVGGAALLRSGVQWRDHVRFDGVLVWQGSKIDDIAPGRLDLAASTANVYYDFSHPDSWIRPYLGVGLGVAGGWLRSDSPAATGGSGRQSGVGMAYLISGGARFPFAEHYSAALAWHFLGTAALIESPSGGSINPTMHAFMVGLHRSF